MISITKHEHILVDVFLRDDRNDKKGVSKTWDDGIRKEIIEMKICMEDLLGVPFDLNTMQFGTLERLFLRVCIAFVVSGQEC